MNYACMTDMSFCTSREVKTKKKLSRDTKKRREFIRSHDFGIDIDSSGNCELKVFERTQNG